MADNDNKEEAQPPADQNADPNEKADEEKSLMSRPKNDITDSSDLRTEIEERTPNKTCCCCCPARSGVALINTLSVFIILAYLIITILLFFNDQIDWWFALTNIVIVAGFGIAAFALIMRYACGPSKSSAKGLSIAMLLIAFMNLLLSIWCITYVK